MNRRQCPLVIYSPMARDARTAKFMNDKIRAKWHTSGPFREYVEQRMDQTMARTVLDDLLAGEGYFSGSCMYLLPAIEMDLRHCEHIIRIES